MTEKRKLKRVPLSRCLNVYDANDEELIGQVLDIHTEGMLLMNQAYLAPKCTYRLKMEVPEELHLHDIVLDAISIWTAKEFEPGCYNTGFRFRNTDNEITQAIRTLIENYGRHIVKVVAQRELANSARHDAG